MGGRGGEELFVQLEVNPVPDGASPLGFVAHEVTN